MARIAHQRQEGIHRWSGWPGAHCLDCGASDPIEQALADNWLDPVTGEWDTEEHRLEVQAAQLCKAKKGVTNGGGK